MPLLDHRVVEFSHRLPPAMKIAGGKGKRLLRRVLHKRVPMDLVERPKQGFGVPIDAWLRGPLRDWAEGLLDESRLRREGYLNPGPVRRAWSDTSLGPGQPPVPSLGRAHVPGLAGGARAMSRPDRNLASVLLASHVALNLWPSSAGRSSGGCWPRAWP